MVSDHTIRISKEIREMLGRSRQMKNESYDNVIRRLAYGKRKKKLKKLVAPENDDTFKKVADSTIGKQTRRDYGV